MPIIQRRKDGSLAVRLPHAEGIVLMTLPFRLKRLLEDEKFNKRVIDRLFPRTYEDEDEELEYRKLMGEDLLSRKKGAIEFFEKTFARRKTHPWGIEIDLKPEEVDPWISLLNDMRLYLGTELDITDNDWSADNDLQSCDEENVVLLHFLTYLQQAVLDSLGFEDPGFGFEDDSEIV